MFSSNLPGCDNNSASIGRGLQCERSALGGRAMHLESNCGTFLTKSANSHILLGRGKSFGRMSGFIPFCVLCNARPTHNRDIAHPPRHTGSKQASPCRRFSTQVSTGTGERGGQGDSRRRGVLWVRKCVHRGLSSLPGHCSPVLEIESHTS